MPFVHKKLNWCVHFSHLPYAPRFTFIHFLSQQFLLNASVPSWKVRLLETKKSKKKEKKLSDKVTDKL